MGYARTIGNNYIQIYSTVTNKVTVSSAAGAIACGSIAIPILSAPISYACLELTCNAIKNTNVNENYFHVLNLEIDHNGTYQDAFSLQDFYPPIAGSTTAYGKFGFTNGFGVNIKNYVNGGTTQSLRLGATTHCDGDSLELYGVNSIMTIIFE